MLGEFLEQAEYDVVCLQEIFSPLNLSLLRQVTRRSYPYLAHGARLPVVAGGVVTLSRWPITARAYRSYPLTLPIHRGWLGRRGVLVSQARIDGRPFTVMNTHLTANRDDDWSSPTNRWVRAEVVELDRLERVVKRATTAAPLLVVGDFNVPRDSTYFTDFVGSAGLRDVLDGDTEPTYRPTRRWPHPPAIDQMLVRPAELTAEARLCLQDQVTLPTGKQVYLSDHFGIEVDITVPEQ